jgi:endonuclease/exonuclease/phosphatase family metal-dependent hydrolase
LSARRALIALAVAGALIIACAARHPSVVAPAAPLVPCGRGDCLRVVTWNLHGIPFLSPRPTARLRNVAAKLREQRPDLVLLQEIWSHAYARELRTALAGEYRMTTATGCGRPWPCGGLAILVRVDSGWVASVPAFVAYEASAPWWHLNEWDGIAKKGMLLATLTRGGESLAVVDTHLQTAYGRHGRYYTKVRRRQLAQLSVTLASSVGERPTIVGGDFNVAAMDVRGLYQSYVAALGDDRTASYRVGCPTCSTRPGAQTPRWLDYVITRHLAATPVTERLLNDGVDQPFSDHDGVLVRLDYAPGALEAR